MESSPLTASTSRPETLIAAVIYLMTHYARTGCPRLALCVSRHLQCLCAHPDVDPVIRDTCAALHAMWSRSGDEAATLQ